MLDIACNNIRFFITSIFTKPHTHRKFTAMTFLPHYALDLYFRIFVSLKRHSNHRDFIDFRHIIHISHLWNTCHNFICLGVFLPTSASFIQLEFYTFSRISQYQSERFRTLLRHSTHRNISSPEL